MSFWNNTLLLKNILLEFFISALHNYTMLKSVLDIGSRIQTHMSPLYVTTRSGLTHDHSILNLLLGTSIQRPEE